MDKHHYGYACINLSLQPLGVTTTRSLIQRTFKSKGLSYVSDLAFANLGDLKKVLTWNISHGFQVFRMTSDIFPWWSEYELSDLPNYRHLVDLLQEIGTLALTNGQRLSFHPDHFNKMGSPDPLIVSKSLRDIEQHSLTFDLMGFVASPYNKINIHIGGAYDDKSKTMTRFCKSFSKLSLNAQKRLTVENDDKSALFSIKELLPLHFDTGIPLVFDYHHHSIYPDGLTQMEAFELAYSTWSRWNIDPVFHYSESGENGIRSHSDYVSKSPNLYGKNVFIMVEAKAKDLAVLNLLDSLV